MKVLFQICVLRAFCRSIAWFLYLHRDCTMGRPFDLQDSSTLNCWPGYAKFGHALRTFPGDYAVRRPCLRCSIEDSPNLRGTPSALVPFPTFLHYDFPLWRDSKVFYPQGAPWLSRSGQFCGALFLLLETRNFVGQVSVCSDQWVWGRKDSIAPASKQSDSGICASATQKFSVMTTRLFKMKKLTQLGLCI